MMGLNLSWMTGWMFWTVVAVLTPMALFIALAISDTVRVHRDTDSRSHERQRPHRRR